MSGKTLTSAIARRNFLARVGVGAGASVLGAAVAGSPAMAADAADAPAVPPAASEVDEDAMEVDPVAYSDVDVDAMDLG